MGDLPRINGLLDLTLPSGATYRSRVEDCEGSLLTIATPTGTGDVEIPDERDVIELAWIASRGRYVMPTRLLDLTHEPPPRWYLLSSGDPVLKSRRRYVRGGGGEPVTIYTEERAPAMSFSGRVIDLSEGGTRCRLDSTDLMVNEPVTICIALPDLTVRLAGTVLALRPPNEVHPEGVDVVVVHQAQEATAKVLRRHVLNWELNERRLRQGRRILTAAH